MSDSQDGADHRWKFPHLGPRLIFLLVAVFTVLLGLDAAIGNDPAFGLDVPILVGAALILFGAAHVLLPSSRLAALAVVCVMLAFVWSCGALTLLGIALQSPVLAALLSMMAVGEVLILVQLYGPIGEICRGMPELAAVQGSVARMVTPFVCALLAMLAGLVVLVDGEFLDVILAGIAAALSLAAVNFGIAPIFAPRVEFAEARIARANRTRELAEHLIARTAIAASPRWAFAGLGIAAVVFGILVFAGGREVPVLSSPVVTLWRQGGPALGFAFLTSAFIAGWSQWNWRAILLTAIPAFLSATAATLLVSILDLASGSDISSLLVLGGCFGMVVSLTVADRFAAYRAEDNAIEVAIQQALNDCAVPVLAATAALVLAGVLLWARYDAGLAVSVLLAAEAVLSLVLTAIFASVVTDLFPPRRSLEDVYGGHPPHA